jgi:hypothetical protein
MHAGQCAPGAALAAMRFRPPWIFALVLADPAKAIADRALRAVRRIGKRF